MRPVGSWIGLVLVLLFTVAAVGEPAPLTVTVVVEGDEVAVEAPATVARALDAAGVTPRDGVLRSVVTGAALDPHWDPATTLVDGVPAAPDELMQPAQALTVVPGEDEVEATVRDEVVVPYARPDVENTLWAPGSDGLDEVIRGEVSGEVVSRTPIIVMEPAREVTDPAITLTFDDGPDPEFTPAVLEALRDANARAMFCVLGSEIRRFPELVREIHEQGHELCNHTETHRDLTGLTREEIETEIADTSAAIVDITGTAPAFFRAPFGAVDSRVIEVAHREEMRVLGWSIDTDDWRGRSAEAMLDAIVDQAEAGAVVLLHDGGGDRVETVEVLPDLLEALVEAGYVLMPPPS